MVGKLLEKQHCLLVPCAFSQKIYSATRGECTGIASKGVLGPILQLLPGLAHIESFPTRSQVGEGRDHHRAFHGGAAAGAGRGPAEATGQTGGILDGSRKNGSFQGLEVDNSLEIEGPSLTWGLWLLDQPGTAEWIAVNN